MMSLWDALRMNMMISYQELVRTFPNRKLILLKGNLDAFNSRKVVSLYYSVIVYGFLFGKF
ncbi:hypothetical protein BL177_00008095 [Klebsiella pneumoniae]|nr:hypothetical protein BL174_00004030 [Klebsiella pneumoniae]ROH32379.1 hypothetical protein BL177_00008095 [Klebsiella pneumoniae]